MKLFIITLFVLFGCGKKAVEVPIPSPVLPVILEPKVEKYSVEEDVLWMQEQIKCRGPSSTAPSEVDKKMTAKTVDRIVNKKGGAVRTKMAFVWLLCQESQFRACAKSPANAIGISQMIISTAQMEADKLGLGKLNPNDLCDKETAILLGYNHFYDLVELHNGNLARAAASYNAGPNGKTVKTLKTGGLGIHETDAYVASLMDSFEERRISKSNK